MEPNEYAYLKLHFPILTNVAALLLSRPALWLYSLSLCSFMALQPSSTDTWPSIYLGVDSQAEKVVIFLGGVGFFFLLVFFMKLFVTLIIRKLLYLMYFLFYPPSWRVESNSVDISDYFNIIHALEKSDLFPN